jgi:hypothetical protein
VLQPGPLTEQVPEPGPLPEQELGPLPEQVQEPWPLPEQAPLPEPGPGVLTPTQEPQPASVQVRPPAEQPPGRRREPGRYP